MGQCIRAFSPLLALQWILCFICPQSQEQLSCLLQSFCSASGSLGSIVQQRAEWRLSLEKTKLLWLQAGERRMSDGKQVLGVGRRGRVKSGEILLVLACGRQLACLCHINFLLHAAWKPLASWPSQIDVPRQAKPTAALYSISIFYTQGSLSQMAFLSFMYFNYLKLRFLLLQLGLRGREQMDLMHLPVEISALDNHLKAKFCRFCLQLCSSWNDILKYWASSSCLGSEW